LTAAAPFTCRPASRCQRGLQWSYTLSADIDQRELATLLQRCWPLVHGVERWAGREVTRLILQFRFELQLNVADGELRLIHRQTAPPEQREADRAEFERILGLCALGRQV
jgi:hypothetical protein